jgi:hypothetical protein
VSDPGARTADHVISRSAFDQFANATGGAAIPALVEQLQAT